MAGSDLRVVQENSRRLVEDYLARLKPGTSPHAVQLWCHMLAGSYRALAITSFLLDADVEAFRRYCLLAERCRSYFLMKVHLGMPAGDEFIAATYDDHLFNALAAGDFETAELLPLWTPSAFVPGLDSESRYRFSMFVRATTGDDDESAATELEQLEALGTDAAPYIKVAQGLHNRDGARFRQGMIDFVEVHQQRAARGELRKEVDELLSVDGVALGRLARHRKIVFQFDHRLVPSALTEEGEYQPVNGGSPKLTDEEWAQFEKFLDGDT
jgi:hypothetical protein